jgi:hypothetical protein
MTENLYPNTDSKFMREVWGTTELITDCWQKPKKKVLQEIENDDLTENSEKSDFDNEIFDPYP